MEYAGSPAILVGWAPRPSFRSGDPHRVPGLKTSGINNFRAIGLAALEAKLHGVKVHNRHIVR